MLLVSQNLANYMDIPETTVVRINLAWVDNLETLEKSLSSFKNDIFIDLPVGRLKPPDNSYDFEDLIEIFDKHNNIKYLAISNVEIPEDIIKYIALCSDSISIVPKIESLRGFNRIHDICEAIPGEKMIMLDHDDLFTDLVRFGVPSSEFFAYVDKLNNFCKQNSVKLLKTRGVIFSDEDKYRYRE